MSEIEELRAEVRRLRLAKGPALFDEMISAVLARAEKAEAEVARLLAECADRESERADLRDRVQKAEGAVARVEALVQGWADYAQDCRDGVCAEPHRPRMYWDVAAKHARAALEGAS